MNIVVLSHLKRFLFGILIGIGLVLIVSGVWFQDRNISGKQTLWVIDTSLSMAVEDITTSGATMMSRLDLAKKIVSQLSRNRPGNQGIIAYARHASVFFPLSDNHDALLQSLQGLKVTDVGGGSDPVSALHLVALLYPVNPPEIIWITDGGSTASGSSGGLPDIKLDLYTVLLGSDVGGKIFLGYNTDGSRRYKIYQGKEVVLPRETDIKSVLDRYHPTVKEIDNIEALESFHIVSGTVPEYAKKDITILIGLICIFCSYFFGIAHRKSLGNSQK